MSGGPEQQTDPSTWPPVGFRELTVDRPRSSTWRGMYLLERYRGGVVQQESRNLSHERATAAPSAVLRPGKAMACRSNRPVAPQGARAVTRCDGRAVSRRTCRPILAGRRQDVFNEVSARRNTSRTETLFSLNTGRRDHHRDAPDRHRSVTEDRLVRSSEWWVFGWELAQAGGSHRAA
jgi:hypothetical protein